MWDNLIKTFGWLRGVAATFALLGFLPNYTSFTQWEILRTVHASSRAWNEVAGWIGATLAKFLSLPDFKAWQINLFIIITSIIIPGLYAFYKHIILKDNPEAYKITSVSIIVSLILSLTLIRFLIDDNKFIDFMIDFSIPLSYMAIAVILMPTYRAGLIFVVGMLVTFEALYLVNIPSVRAEVNKFSCRVSDLPVADR